MNGYGAIAANDEAGNIFYIVLFTYFLYTLQEYVEPDGNQLSYIYPVCNAIYTSSRLRKSRYYVEQYSYNNNCECVN